MSETEHEPVVDERAATGHGWPYPVASDPVAGGAAAIQALATMLEAWLQPAGGILAIPVPSKITDGGGNNTLVLVSQGGACVLRLDTTDPNPANRNFAIRQRYSGLGLLEFVVSAAQGGDPNGGIVGLTMDSTGLVNAKYPFTIGSKQPLRTHYGNSSQIADPVLGPSNNTNSYTIAFLEAFSLAPIVVTEKTADVFNTTITTTGVTINQTGGSGNQYRGVAMGNA
jgi:hypothetical protein